jgi:hypothetical protein
MSKHSTSLREVPADLRAKLGQPVVITAKLRQETRVVVGNCGYTTAGGFSEQQIAVITESVLRR